jgi:hypothetical protein
MVVQLPTGSSGAVRKKEKHLLLKHFYSDRNVEFKREVFAYLVIQEVAPTLKMVSFDLIIQIGRAHV